MKKPLMIMFMVTLFCFSFGCQQGEEVAEEPLVDIEAEVEAIRAADTAWLKAAEEKDVDAMASFLAEDFAFTGYANLRDKAAFHEIYTKQFSLEGREISWVTDKIFVADSGDLAYSLSTFEDVRVIDGETKTDIFTTLVVWKKQPDGNWKVVAGF